MNDFYDRMAPSYHLVYQDWNGGIESQARNLVKIVEQQMYQCTRRGGGCLLTVRDYDQEERGSGVVKLYGLREDKGTRFLIFQVWDFVGDIYDLSMYFIADDHRSSVPETQVMRSKYYAIGTDQLLGLMLEAGFRAVERLDGVFFQPVLVGTKQE